LNLESRLQWAVQGYSQTQFFYGQLENIFYDPAFSGLIDRDLAVATRTLRGGTIFGIYPFNRYRRVELYGGYTQYTERFDDPGFQQFSEQYQQEQFGRQLFNNGSMVPLGVAFTQETTIFREFGPLAGSTARFAFEHAPKIGDTLSRTTFDVDARKYLRIGGSGLFAMRVRGFKSIGDNPDFLYFGGNSEMRGYEYLTFVGQDAFFANAELRFPLIDAMATPIGILGGIRGTFFAGICGATWADNPFKPWTTGSEVYRPIIGYSGVVTNPQPVYGDPVALDGFRLIDSRASYGVGLQTFALGFPIHFDWAWKTLFNRDWEDALFAEPCRADGQLGCGGSSTFRKVKFSVWIGYDF
jgi:outer membrane protein assembly factor BamA